MTEHVESEFMYHIACDACGSSDANSLYTDGHQFCHACEAYVPPDGGISPSSKQEVASNCLDINDPSVGGYYTNLQKRKIPESTCRKYGYWVGTYKGEKVQVANYVKEGVIVGQKVRTANKEFLALGKLKSSELFGKHLFPNGGKRIIITEGEIDALTVSHVQGDKWPVVSLPLGAKSAKKACANNYDYLNLFDEIVLMFDNDETGQDAVQEAASVLPSGKVYIAKLPLKDANECLQKGLVKDIVNAIWNAEKYVPDGVVLAASLKERVLNKSNEVGLLFPNFPLLNDATLGINWGSVVLVTSGSGSGKSTFVRQLAYIWGHLKKIPMGLAMLEEQAEETVLDIMGLHCKKRLRQHPELLTDEEKEKLFDELFEDNEDYYLYDTFAEADIDRLLSKFEYMVKALGRKILILDHINIVVSAQGELKDERKLIDNLMTKLKALAKNNNIILFVICHLRNVEGKAHEDGGKVSISHLRGSGALRQLIDLGLALERNQQGNDSNMLRIRVLKARFNGKTGLADVAKYDDTTGWLKAIEDSNNVWNEEEVYATSDLDNEGNDF